MTCRWVSLNDLVSYTFNPTSATRMEIGTATNDISAGLRRDGPYRDASIGALQPSSEEFLTLTLWPRQPMLRWSTRAAYPGGNKRLLPRRRVELVRLALLERHGDVRRFVERLVAHRLRLVTQLRWHDHQTLADFLREAHIQIHGVNLDQPDWSDESHSLAFTARGPAGRMFHIMINAYWKALAFELPPATAEGTAWRRWIDTSLASPDDICEGAEASLIASPTYLVQPHSIACLFAQPPG